jgi:hypothetical protein
MDNDHPARRVKANPPRHGGLSWSSAGRLVATTPTEEGANIHDY